MPDAFGFVLVGTIVIFVAGVLCGETPVKMVDSWGKGFWSLIPFTLQMAMIIIGGYAVATSRVLGRFIAWIAQIPTTPRQAVVLTAFVSMFTSYLNWAFALIFTAILALVVLVLAWLMTPSPEQAVTAEEMGITLTPVLSEEPEEALEKPRPGDILERSPVITVLILLVGLAYLIHHFRTGAGSVFDRLDLNAINMILILLGLLLQYPLYGGIFGMIVYTGLSERIAHFLVHMATGTLYPAMIGLFCFPLVLILVTLFAKTLPFP